MSTIPAPYYIPREEEYMASNYTALKRPCVIDGVEYSSSDNFSGVPANYTFTTVLSANDSNYSAPDVCLYNLDRLYATQFSGFLESTLLNGSCDLVCESGPELILCPDAFWLAPPYESGNASISTISTRMDQFATTVTNRLAPPARASVTDRVKRLSLELCIRRQSASNFNGSGCYCPFSSS